MTLLVTGRRKLGCIRNKYLILHQTYVEGTPWRKLGRHDSYHGSPVHGLFGAAWSSVLARSAISAAQEGLQNHQTDLYQEVGIRLWGGLLCWTDPHHSSNPLGPRSQYRCHSDPHEHPVNPPFVFLITHRTTSSLELLFQNMLVRGIKSHWLHKRQNRTGMHNISNKWSKYEIVVHNR